MPCRTCHALSIRFSPCPILGEKSGAINLPAPAPTTGSPALLDIGWGPHPQAGTAVE